MTWPEEWQPSWQLQDQIVSTSPGTGLIHPHGEAGATGRALVQHLRALQLITARPQNTATGLMVDRAATPEN